MPLLCRRTPVISTTIALFLGSLLGGTALAQVHNFARPTANHAHPDGGAATTQSVLYDFCSTGGADCTDGATPMGQLAQAADGNFYGTTEFGGVNGEAFGGYGTVYKMTPGGTLTTVYAFCSQTNCTDGLYPETGVVQGGDGNFYGVTYQGGTNIGFGTIFKLTPSGTLTTLYSFSNNTDGGYPSGPLLLASDGNFYGTTNTGGASGPGGYGTVFQITPAGTFKTIYSFCSLANCADGSTPAGGLLEGSDGNLYGTTQSGGSNSSGCDSYGCGTLFRLTKAGALTTLYSFQSGTDGGNPEVAPTEASDGSYYGATLIGGTPSDGCGGFGCGTAYQFVPSGQSGTLNTLYSFTGAGDGGSVNGPLKLASDGNFYDTTSYYTTGAGATGGTAFQMTPAGSVTTLYTFCTLTNCTDGELPSDGVVQGSDGNLYGVTEYGGTNNTANGGEGTAYKVAFTNPLAGPIQLTVNTPPYAGRPVTVYFQVKNAFSLTSQQCYAFATDETTPAFYALGKVKGTLASGVFSGSFVVTPPSAGTYTGALTCGGINSGYITGTVGTPFSTALTLAAAPNPVIGGSNVMLTATATRTSGSGTPTGSVTFYYGSMVLGTASLNGSGVATLTASSSIAPVGSYQIFAVYGGNYDDSSSTSNTVTVQSEKGTTATSLKASPNPVTEGQKVNLTATVSTNDGPVTGTVTFHFGSMVLGSAPVSGGVAQLSASSAGVPPGSYSITATYGGSGHQSASTSSPVLVVVEAQQ
jgi:uncharacterized repeat protein (TIGR03803 family)